MDTINVMGEVDTITSEQIAEQDKADKEAQLVPQGTFEGLVVTWSKLEEHEKGENNQFKGIPQYRVGIRFFDCPENGKSKSGFFNMTPQKIVNENGRPKAAYTSMVGLVKAMHMEGKPVTEALEQGKVTRAKYRVGQFETPEGNTVNFLRSVSTV